MKYSIGIISLGLLALGQNPASAGTVYGRVFDTLRNAGSGAVLANAKVTLRSNPQQTVTLTFPVKSETQSGKAL
jgi:hypothetical protein